MPLPEQDEIDRFHRYFAVECNNNAWELADLADRSDEQTQEMIRLAEVAAWHWSKVGRPIHFARADMLLGWACCLVGQSEYARGYTDAVRTQLDAEPEGLCEWDNAFLALLEAYTLVNEGVLSGLDDVSAGLDSARAKLNDEEERQVFDRFRSVVTG